MITLLILCLTACATSTDSSPDVCTMTEYGEGSYLTLEEYQDICGNSPEVVWNETYPCEDGRVEYFCSAHGNNDRLCFNSEGLLIGSMWPTSWYPPRDEPDLALQGYGEWCDCDGDGWPPTVEEYCERRGEVLPE